MMMLITIDISRWQTRYTRCCHDAADAAAIAAYAYAFMRRLLATARHAAAPWRVWLFRAFA